MAAFASAMGLMLFATHGGAQDVLYCETFANDSGRGLPLADFGWHYHLGPQGWTQQDNGATYGLVNENLGSAAGTIAVAAGVEADSDRGFVVNALGPDGEQDADPFWNQFTHYFTDELTVDRDQFELTEVAFDLALSQPDQVRITVRIGEQWFASAQSFTTTPVNGHEIYGGFAAKAERKNLDPRGEAWLPFSFVPQTTMGLDTQAVPVSLPSGDLEAVGLLLAPTGFEAFDNITILGSPLEAEPE
ncbi:MAG: hypothetical protein AAF911_12445 [Planctomycetota bacterium]